MSKSVIFDGNGVVRAEMASEDKMPKYEIRFQVSYCTVLECEEYELDDRLSDIDIPESLDIKYKENSFLVLEQTQVE